MTAFYNEIDPYAAQWLRNLIAAGHIAPGVVDERSIQDIAPDELKEFTQCHFFAGVGVWSLALRRAGWPDERPVWTGSCPCQPFSAAGAGAGFSDLRHLWPDFAWQIDQCRPAVVFGEQVASKVIDTWVDLVQVDLETMGYAFGAIPFPSAGVGAPHIRDRLFWVADSDNQQRIGRRADFSGHGHEKAWCESERSLPTGGLGNAIRQGLEECVSYARILGGAAGAGAGQTVERASVHPGGMGHPYGDHSGRDSGDGLGAQTPGGSGGPLDGHMCNSPGLASSASGAGPVNGFWRAADWLGCRDDKWRPVEPGTFPLAHGAPSRVGRLRAYGNAINAQAAQEFIGAYLDAVSTKE